MNYTAVVLAGSRPGGDPFARQFGNDIKALIAVGGEPMIRRPVRALLASANVGEVIILTQAPDRIASVIAPIHFRARTYATYSAGMRKSIPTKISRRPSRSG